jgi:hypothetical protein
MHGTVSIAWIRCNIFVGSLMYLSMRREYILLWIFLAAIWKPQKHRALDPVTLAATLLLRFSLAMPSEEAKNARTWEMKWHSVLDSLSHSVRSVGRGQFLLPSRKKLWLSYTSARCWCGVWIRVQSDVGSPAVAVWEQGVLFLWSCVMTIARAGWEPSWPSSQHGLC